MALYDAARIHKLPYFRLAPLTRGRSERLPYVIGFDSEAERGRPFLFQFAHPVRCPIHQHECDVLDVPTGKHAGLWTFVDYLAAHCTDKRLEYIIFGFNLQYEWTQLFGDVPYDVKIASDFDVTLRTGKLNTARLRATNSKRYMATIELGGTKRRVKLIDAMAYFPTSLDNAAQAIEAGEKLPKPKRFSRKAARTADFLAYAKQDAILTQKLGEYVIGLHERYDVPTCISAPHFAARTFRRHYLEAEIPLPAEPLEQFGLDSYHGGKNGYYLPKPALLSNVWHYDIRSAYPEAMHQLPNVEASTWQAIDQYEPNVHALWEVSGYAKRCTYRALMGHDAHWLSGRFSRARVTSYELDAALALGEVKITHCTGWIMRGEPHTGPLARYVDDFYAMKRDAITEAVRTAAKLFLVSLYGKFFQKTPLGNVTGFDIDTHEIVQTDPEQEWDYEAGGLYHPPIASLITGYVRAKIHRLEHRYSSLMTSTDGFFATQAPDPADLGGELGMLTAEVGKLRIWRERLYVFTPRKRGEKPSIALHGFRGTVAQLKRVPLRAGNKFHYLAEAMITLKMSTRSFDGKRYRPGEFVALPFDVILPRAQGP